MEHDFIAESRMRQLAPSWIDRGLELWHQAAEERGLDVPVRIGNLRANSGLSALPGIKTEAALSSQGEQGRLTVWYDPYETYYAEQAKERGASRELESEIRGMLERKEELPQAYDPVSHPETIDWGTVMQRLALWILKMRGFKRLENGNEQFREVAHFLNIELWVPALYRVLEEAGYDYRPEIAKSVAETLTIIGTMAEPSRRIERALNALRLVNMYRLAEPQAKGELLARLKESFPRVYGMMDEIGTLIDAHDTLNPAETARLGRALILRYRFPGDWNERDEVQGILY